MARYDDILATIGRTPAVRLQRLSPPGTEIWAKVESFNPMGSVKDRLALALIEQAERSGRLAPGQTVIEATSGNTGIALAMVCARKGHPLVVTMAENFSVERRKLLRFLGARVVLTPASEKGSGMLAKAEELAEAHGWFLCRQFESEVNADAHSQTTAREILEDFGPGGLDYWVSGFGTGGTLKGVARVLKQESPGTRIVACEPDNAPVLASGIQQKRRHDGAPAESHPCFRPHLMQGWSPDFVSKLTEDAVSQGLVDEIVPVAGAEALRLSRELAHQEGILAGISSGATLAAALEVARRAEPGSRILCMLPDTGERYLSTPLFEDITEAMSEEELALSRSTPSMRFDTTPPPAPPTEGTDGVKSDAQIEQLVSDLIDDPEEPVVMFALEWCEFCWSARRLFKRLGIRYRSVDLDSVAYQVDDLGPRIRGELERRTGARTIPRIFVGGTEIGGCTDLMDAWSDGRLAALLRASGVAFDPDVEIDPGKLLPGWLQPR